MLEIERKFLVKTDEWRKHTQAQKKLVQGYLNKQGKASVRVRLEDDQANINIKAAVIGAARAEYEYPIDVQDAKEILSQLTAGVAVHKTRHYIQQGPHTWEIDEFHGDNAGLVVAEIELSSEKDNFEKPAWLGQEVTAEKRYYNHALAFHPFSEWT